MLDVATAAHVSLATVSRALRDDPRITPSVRERVKAAAELIGYTPNPLVQALMTQRRRRLGAHEETLALVTNVPDGVWRKKDVCRWYLQGIEARAQQLGYRIEIFPLSELRGDVARMRHVLVARGIRGIILGFSGGEDQARSMDVKDFCVVGLGTYFQPLTVDRVQLHGFFNVKLAFEKMRALGYRKPALVTPMRNNTVVGGQWSAAALNDQWQRPAEEQCPPLVVEGEQVNMMAFREWYEHHRPDALLAYKFDVMEVLERLGIHVPQNVGVAQLIGTDKERLTMAGIDGNLDRVGAAAVDLLVQKMHIHERGLADHPRDVLITGSWQDGPTLPPRLLPKGIVRPRKKA